MKTYAYGFPKTGLKNQFDKLLNGFRYGKIEEEQFIRGLVKIQNENEVCYQENVDLAPEGEMSFYDAMLDTAIMCGVHTPEDLSAYYGLCLGDDALAVKRWFNTNNYSLNIRCKPLAQNQFQLNFNHFALQFKQKSFPTVIGPFTFLKLSTDCAFSEFRRMFYQLTSVYVELLSRVKTIQIEEPAFTLPLTDSEISLIKDGYGLLSATGSWILLLVYYNSAKRLPDIIRLPVIGIGLDFVRGHENFNYLCKHGFAEDKLLIAGLVDGRSVWKTNIAAALRKLKALHLKIKNIAVSNAAPLHHVPVALESEPSLEPALKKRLAFAKEKLDEINLIADYFNLTKQSPLPYVKRA